MKLYLYIFIASVIFAGCGGSKNLQLNLQCDDNCNNSNVIVIKIYQLKNPEKFKHASLESLVRKPEETLADDLIANSKFEKIMAPGEKFNVESLEILSGAAYIGVLGDFNSPAKDGWQQVISLESGIDNISIQIKENSLAVETDD